MQLIKKIASFLVAIFLVETVFAFLLEPVTFEHFLAFDERSMNKGGQEAELTFFGDSRSIRSYDSVTIDKEMGTTINGVMNEGVNQQHLLSTYYYMKDYFKHHDLKMAVVNLNYDYFLAETTEPFEAKGLTYDRIESISGMAEFVWERFSPKEYPDIIKSYRYRWQVKNIPLNVKSKLTREYWTGIDKRSDIHYVKNGFVTWDLTYAQGNTGTPAGCIPWSEADSNEEAFAVLDKIAALGKEYDVQIVFVESPVTMGRLYALDGYGDFEKKLTEKCDSLNVPFYNLNLLKQENVSMDDTSFSDTEHLNETGAKKVSRILADILVEAVKAGSPENKAEEFYASFEEMNKELPQIGACDLEIISEGEGKSQDVETEQTAGMNNTLTLQATSFAAPSITPLYQFSYSTDNGSTFEILQEYEECDHLILPGEYAVENALFKVETKPKEGQDLHHCYMIRSINE